MSIWNGKYLSIKTIIEKVQRDTKAVIDLNLYDAIEWAGEAIELIGAPMYLIDKHDCITIEEFKGKLPCDLHLLLGTRDHDTKIAMRYSTDSFHSSLVCQDINVGCVSDLTYTINDDYMFTSFEEGTVEISYKALPTDKEGFPLIPDDIKFVKAVSSYLMERCFLQAWIANRVEESKYRHFEREWLFYVRSAQNRANLPSVDMAESLKNQWLRLIPKINQHATGFKSTGEAEQRYTHNSTAGGSTETGEGRDTIDTFFQS